MCSSADADHLGCAEQRSVKTRFPEAIQINDHLSQRQPVERPGKLRRRWSSPEEATAKGRSLTVFYGKVCAKFQKTCVTRTAGKGRNSLCHHYSANRVCSSPLRNNHMTKRSGSSETTKNSGPPRR